MSLKSQEKQSLAPVGHFGLVVLHSVRTGENLHRTHGLSCLKIPKVLLYHGVGRDPGVRDGRLNG